MLDERVICGVEAFNAGEYFKAHEIWEAIWREVLPPEKDYYQALIQAAVALHHWNNGNVPGAHRLATRALGRLERFDPMYLQLNTRQLRQVLGQILNGHLSEPKHGPTTSGLRPNQADTKVYCFITYAGIGRDEQDCDQDPPMPPS